MADIVPFDPNASDVQRADRLDRELAEAEGITRMLRGHLETLAGIEIPPGSAGGWYQVVCTESSKVVTAISRLRQAHAASVLALARLRSASLPRHLVIEHRYPDDDTPDDAA
jgi:hypothetical protein